MRKWINRGLSFALSILVSLSVCDAGRADDDKTGNDSKPATVKPAESKPERGLTDRERWLLERVEQLEKRVADLESKDAKPAVEAVAVKEKGPEPGANVSGGMTNSATPVTSARSVTPATASMVAVPSSMSASIAAA